MARPILSAISIFFLAAGIVLEIFIILSGAVNSSPMNHVYFLQAETSGISGGSKSVPNPARWTYFAICSVRKGLNAACGPVTAALPFDPKRNFSTRNGLPNQIAGNTSQYYYLSRVAWSFFIIALFFAVVALLLSVTALCSRLAAKFTGMVTMTALIMQTVAAALMTAWTILARNAFRKNGQDANLGKYAYGFTWAAMACYLISTILFCMGGSGDRNDSYQKKSYFGRKQSTRSRGSFRDSDHESGRRVKDEYE